MIPNEQPPPDAIGIPRIGSKRECSGCSLCCRLVPVPALQKDGWQKCVHQRFRTGCAVYARRPPSCRIFMCKWLANVEIPPRMMRPDRSHYVIDTQPDFVSIDGELQIPCEQVWMDPNYPEAKEDPALREFIEYAGEEKHRATLLRWGKFRSTVIFSPSMSTDEQWHELEVRIASDLPPHTLEEIAKVTNSAVVKIGEGDDGPQT